MKKIIVSIAAAAMLVQAPAAQAGYWTGHAEIIRTIIENWILNHTRTADPQTPGSDRSQPLSGTQRWGGGGDDAIDPGKGGWDGGDNGGK